jgi:tetratricopeptide (TPR) repeat protein/transcriptional regulator with XRE-family HTH domain
VAEPPVTFAGLLRTLRAQAQLTQEELAEASGVRPRTVSDLERGVATTPQRETIRRLADALGLTGPARAQFEAVARGRAVSAAAAAGGPAAATRTLPRDVASFTGRHQELQELAGVAAGATSAGGVVSIHAIGGMAGVGKTAFAVHAAHRLADRFPAGQIFLPLHGHTPGQQPVDPADALASLLTTFGIPTAQIPAGLEARMALWRDRLAEKQLLLILDDAASSEQVRPLLPGTGGSLVLVTSRRHLSALDDATAVSLDTLPAEEAAGLLVQLAGRAGLRPDDPAVAEIIRLCGYLPLAIGMAARQLHHHPAWTAAGRAGELAAAVDRLELMSTENVSVAAAFDLSYANLSEEHQRLFRRLSLHPGTDIDAYAAAALDSTGLAAARRGLEALYNQYLMAEPAEGRYRMHDLIREHARALADRIDLDRDRDVAVTRLLDYYQHTAGLAQDRLARQTRPGPPPPTAAPVAAPALDDARKALAWARADRDSLLACLNHVYQAGQYARVTALTAALTELLRRDGPWAEAITRHAAAAQSARDLGDRLGQANALNNLGDVRRLTGDYPGAAADLEQALAIYRDLGDPLGQSNALNNLGIVRRGTGDYPGAAADLEQALAISRDLGDPLGQSNALFNLGAVRRLTGDLQNAVKDLEQALAISRDLGDPLGQSNALFYLGDVRRGTGDYPGAAGNLVQALTISRDLGDRLGQAGALLELGDLRRLTGDYRDAAGDVEEALAIYRDLGDRLGQAGALQVLGEVRQQTGDYLGAAGDLEQALAISRDIGDRLGQANALACLGITRREAGDYPGAAEDLEQALAIYRDIGERFGQTGVLNEIGTLHRVTGEPAKAEDCHHQALELARALGSASDEAHALAGLGRCAVTAGHIIRAEVLLRQAHEIFHRIGAADAPSVLAELDSLASHDPRGRP